MPGQPDHRQQSTSATASPNGSTAGSATAGRRPTGSRSRMPSCGRSCSTPPRRTRSTGTGSRVMPAIRRTSAPTSSPAPRPSAALVATQLTAARNPRGSIPASSDRQRLARESATRTATTPPARSGCPCRPARRTRRSRGDRDRSRTSSPGRGRRSGGRPICARPPRPASRPPSRTGRSRWRRRSPRARRRTARLGVSSSGQTHTLLSPSPLK